MIDATIQNFEDEIIQASMTVPVLVDFWSLRSPACTTLSPILEKLEADYKGRFQLAKVDCDQEQQIAQAFGVRSIPTCVLLMSGKPVDGFQGALTESQVRELLDKHLPPALEEPEQAMVEALPLTPEEQLAALQASVAADPTNDSTRFHYLKALLLANRDDDAKVALAPAINKLGLSRQLDAIQRWLDARDFAHPVTSDAINSEAARAYSTLTIAEFDTKISTNKRDFDARFSRAQLLMAQSRWTDAMDALLDILMRDKTWSEDKARKTFIAILEIIATPPVKVADGQIPPEDPVVATYRRRLSSVVLS